VAEAWETKGGVRPSASWQAVTCVNTETAPKYTMRRPTLPGLGEGCHGLNISGRRVQSASPGWWVTACQQGATGNTGNPSAVAGYRLGQQPSWTSGHGRVSEGFIVLMKPGNAGGGKGPWFRDANEAAREGGD
jgi:hypothetical protein